MNSTRKLLTAAAAVAALGLAGAAPAAADSLVYVKGHDVWLANTDGSGQYQVTTDGTADNPWTSPSQADDGTIVAARAKPTGGPLYRLRQNGELINQIPVAAVQAGPHEPAVSPDGALVAYSHTFSKYVNGWLEVGTDVRYARADGSGGADGFPGVSTGATTPSWIDSSTTLVGRGSVGFVQHPGSAATHWWSDYDHYGIFGSGADLSDGEAAGGRLVMVRSVGQAADRLAIYSTPNGTAATPAYDCTVSEPSAGGNGPKFADPTLSSDGRRLFTQQGDGIYAATMPSSGGCDGWTDVKLIDGAAEPDWGPANVNPGPRPAPAPAPGPSPAPAPSPGPAPSAAPRGTPAPAPGDGSTAKSRAGARRATPRRCLRLRGAKRAACVTQAKRARAVARCKRTKRGKARTRCVKATQKLR